MSAVEPPVLFCAVPTVYLCAPAMMACLAFALAVRRVAPPGGSSANTHDDRPKQVPLSSAEIQEPIVFQHCTQTIILFTGPCMSRARPKGSLVYHGGIATSATEGYHRKRCAPPAEKWTGLCRKGPGEAAQLQTRGRTLASLCLGYA